MLGVYSIVENSTDTADGIIREDKIWLAKESALTRLETDLTHLFSPLFFDQKESAADREMVDEQSSKLTKSGYPIVTFNSVSKNEIIFMSHGHRRVIEDSKHSNYMWVRYFVKASSRGEGESLYRQIKNFDINNQSTIDWDDIKSYEILPYLKEFSFSFYSKEKERYVDRITDLGAKESSLPPLIKVSLTWFPPTGEEEQIERVFRPMWPPFDFSLDKAGAPTEQLQGEAL